MEDLKDSRRIIASRSGGDHSLLILVLPILIKGYFSLFTLLNQLNIREF
jgi:hypothetical protein